MNKLTAGIFVASVLAAASFSAQAGDINYNYVDLTYDSADASGTSGTGIGAGISFGITDNLYLVGNYDSADFPPTLSEINFGLGYHQSLNNTTDWYAEGRYRTTDIGTADPTGYMGMFGVRMAASSQAEVKAGVGYGSLSSGGTTFSGVIFDLGGVYNVTDQIGIALNYYSDNDSFGWNVLRLGARFNF